MQIVELNLDHDNFFCPVTGQKIIGSEAAYESSPATVFCFVDESGEFESISNEAKAIYDQVDVGEDDFSSDVFIKFADLYTDPNVVCFVITTSGMACGPISFTVRFGINMNYVEEESGLR